MITQTIQWEGTDIEGQPTLEDLTKAEAQAIAEPTNENLDNLLYLVNARTTYYGKDYMISSRIRNYLFKQGRSQY
jgi:hypothetical protein